MVEGKNEMPSTWMHKGKTLWNWASSIITVGAGVAAIIGLLYPGTVNEYLSNIYDSSERVGESVDDLIEVTKRQPDAVKSDPIKELNDRGYGFDTEDFERAIRADDVVSVDLYCSAGKKKWLTDKYILLNFLNEDYKVDKIIRNCPAYDMENFCSMDSYYYFEDTGSTESEEALINRYNNLCGIGAYDEIALRVKDKIDLRRIAEDKKDAERKNICEKIGSDFRGYIGRMAAQANEHFYYSRFIGEVALNYTYRDKGVDDKKCKELGVDFEKIWNEETTKQ